MFITTSSAKRMLFVIKDKLCYIPSEGVICPEQRTVVAAYNNSTASTKASRFSAVLY